MFGRGSMYERFTDRSRKIMQLAAKKAKQRGDCYLGIHHLLIALIEDGSGMAANVLRQLEVNVAKVYAEAVASEPACNGTAELVDSLLHTSNTKKALEHANEVATYLGHNYVGTEHLLLGLLKTSHPVIDVLSKAGIDYINVYEKIVELVSHDERKTPSKEEIAINFYHGVLKRIMKVCEENSNDNGMKEIQKIVKRAILDGGKWNIS